MLACRMLSIADLCTLAHFALSLALDGSELAHAELVSIAILIDFNWQPALADFIDSQGHVPWMQF